MKRAIRLTYGLFIFPFILITLSHCAALHRQTSTQSSELNNDRMAEDIRSLKEITRRDPDPAERAKAHIRLAKLYSSHRNPARDYNMALKELEMAVYIDPAEGKTDNVQNLLAMLRELDRSNEQTKALSRKIDLLVTQNGKAMDSADRLKRRADQLFRENKELKNSLRELKSLDVRIEQKRKNIR